MPASDFITVSTPDFARRGQRPSGLSVLVNASVCVALVMIAAPSALAGSLEEGKAAYLARDYIGALEILRPLAEQGEAAAQVTLGIMYDYGQGVPEDDAAAMLWYGRAALQGHVNLQHNLGVKFFEGIDIPKDPAQAVRWWRLAADSGFAESQYSLGELYAFGAGLEKDEREAARWYRLAADQGHALAQYRLGVMYAAGRGVRLDYPQAYSWLRKSADQGMAQAQYQAGRLAESGTGTARDMNEAVRWYRLAAGQGLEKAKQRLAGLEARAATPNAAGASGNGQSDPARRADNPAEVVARRNVPPATAIGNNREDWIRAQSPHHFTLQLVTASKEQSVVEVIALAHLGAEVAVFKRELNGTIAYSAVYGVFETQEEAKDAVAALPARARDAKPWVRPFADIQALLIR